MAVVKVKLMNTFRVVSAPIHSDVRQNSSGSSQEIDCKPAGAHKNNTFSLPINLLQPPNKSPSASQ